MPARRGALNTNAPSEWEVTVSGVTASVNAEDIASFEFGVAFGLGANFDVGPCSIVIDGRYAMGVTTIDDSSTDTDIIDRENREWIIMAGVGFPVGGSK